MNEPLGRRVDYSLAPAVELFGLRGSRLASGKGCINDIEGRQRDVLALGSSAPLRREGRRIRNNCYEFSKVRANTQFTIDARSSAIFPLLGTTGSLEAVDTTGPMSEPSGDPEKSAPPDLRKPRLKFMMARIEEMGNGSARRF